MLLIFCGTASAQSLRLRKTHARALELMQSGANSEAIALLKHEIENSADWGDGWLTLGSAQEASSDFDAAKKSYDQSVRLLKNDPHPLSRRGILRWKRGDHDEACDDFRSAIQANPSDLGVEFLDKNPVTRAADLETPSHGKAQIDALLRDRPSLATLLPYGSNRWSWVCQRFQVADHGNPVEWDPAPPESGQAECVSAELGGYIRLRVAESMHTKSGQKIELSPEELLHRVVFELFNASNIRTITALFREVEKGRLRRHFLVRECTRLEVEALQKTRAFFVVEFLPSYRGTLERNGATLWYLNEWRNVNAFLQTPDDGVNYPWNPYGNTYDLTMLPLLYEECQFKTSVRFATRLLNAPISNAEKHYCLFQLGRSELMCHNPDAAVAAFTQSITLDGAYKGYCYSYRGYGYLMLDQSLKAKDDFDSAKVNGIAAEVIQSLLNDADQERESSQHQK